MPCDAVATTTAVVADQQVFKTLGMEKAAAVVLRYLQGLYGEEIVHQMARGGYSTNFSTPVGPVTIERNGRITANRYGQEELVGNIAKLLGMAGGRAVQVSAANLLAQVKGWRKTAETRTEQGFLVMELERG